MSCEAFTLGLPLQATTPPPRECGNGILEDGEQCDDGNDLVSMSARLKQLHCVARRL